MVTLFYYIVQKQCNQIHNLPIPLSFDQIDVIIIINIYVQ